jgi:hypothetical protein
MEHLSFQLICRLRAGMLGPSLATIFVPHALGSAPMAHLRVVAHGLNDLCRHEAATHLTCAGQIAALLGASFGDEHGLREPDVENLYFVPSSTLLHDEAQRLRIAGESDLFGGAVPAEFVATKSISHPLVTPDAFAPRGWSREFEEDVSQVVLKGLTAFSIADAQRIGQKLTEMGPVRVKPASASGSQGQRVITRGDELRAVLSEFEGADVQKCGLVLEENLTNVSTYSVGFCRIAKLAIAYWGTQRSSQNNYGETIYGGSDLYVVRGDCQQLLSYDLPRTARLAIDQARRFDASVSKFYPSVFASRRNYDVAQGTDWQGRWRSGILAGC